VMNLDLHLPDRKGLHTDAGQLASISLTMRTEEAYVEEATKLRVLPYSLEVHDTTIVEMRLSESRCCLLPSGRLCGWVPCIA